MRGKQNAWSQAVRWLLHWTQYVMSPYAPFIHCVLLMLTWFQKGPEIRTGNTKGDEDIPISEGAEINITTDDKYAAACDDKNM